MTVRVCPICDIADCATHRPKTSADRIEELEREMDALQDRLDTANKARADANFRANENQFKLAKAVETLEQITTIICSAVQGDNEHGVRSLNEIAAKNYLKDFPLTLAAITEVQDVIDAALAELEGMNE